MADPGRFDRRLESIGPTCADEDHARLRETVAGLPAAPGVYTFHGEEGGLPLYIGKSVNLRSRVLAHLRNPEELRMLRQTRRISIVRTAGDLGAQLLEARLIKQQQPLLNQKLRRARQLCAWRMGGSRPELVDSIDFNFATEPRLYGLYGSRHAAQEGLRQLADAQRLCYGVLGLEKLVRGRACFRAMLKQCAGACCGGESLVAHHQRLLAALECLRVACWPYEGAIALVERHADLTQWHVVRNWCYLGSAPNAHEARQLDIVAVGFDADGYRILCKPILSGCVQVLEL